ncbi:hypothetical protein B0H14DRAFT_2587347 [Mycena olivaceomarginata]|nr:hypothetical protein B0H14DRAFT_2587347 [Mycena olivaceomarginata]
MYPSAVQLWENFVCADRYARLSVDSNQQPRKKWGSADPRGRSIIPSVELRSGRYIAAPRDIREVAMRNQRGNRGGPEAPRMELRRRTLNPFLKPPHPQMLQEPRRRCRVIRIPPAPPIERRRRVRCKHKEVPDKRPERVDVDKEVGEEGGEALPVSDWQKETGQWDDLGSAEQRLRKNESGSKTYGEKRMFGRRLVCIFGSGLVNEDGYEKEVRKFSRRSKFGKRKKKTYSRNVAVLLGPLLNALVFAANGITITGTPFVQSRRTLVDPQDEYISGAEPVHTNGMSHETRVARRHLNAERENEAEKAAQNEKRAKREDEAKQVDLRRVERLRMPLTADEESNPDRSKHQRSWLTRRQGTAITQNKPGKLKFPPKPKVVAGSLLFMDTSISSGSKKSANGKYVKLREGYRKFRTSHLDTATPWVRQDFPDFG